MQKNTWIEYQEKPNLKNPIAIVGSPGLRSIGKVVVDYLIKELKLELFANLYSKHFPIIYETKPAYASHPNLPGTGGIKIISGEPNFPKVQFYWNNSPPLIVTSGHHANFQGQYEVAEKVLDLYKKFKVKRIIVVAGYGSEGKEVCCAATDKSIIDEMKKKFNIEVDYTGPFYGFSGIVFGLAKSRGIEAVCLFGKTEAIQDKPEIEDEEASKKIIEKLKIILNLKN